MKDLKCGNLEEITPNEDYYGGKKTKKLSTKKPTVKKPTTKKPIKKTGPKKKLVKKTKK